MKRILLVFFLLVVLGLSGWLGYYFYQKSASGPEVFKTESPFVTNIIKKTVATGAIVPRREVQIKSQVSGIIEELYVEAGEPIKAGQMIAKIRIVPDVVSVNNAETNLQRARINFEESKRELARQEGLLKDQVISDQEFRRFKLDFELNREALDAAESNLQLVREGASKKTGRASNLVYSTVTGMVLDVPVKQGGSVIERNNFNEGTTIASVADMKSLIFEGKIDESEVGKIRENMDLELTVGAIEGKTYKAKLEHISPKGITEEGAIKFPVRATVMLPEGEFIRAGYSANADIVLDRRDSVLALKESLLLFENEKPYVEVETGPQKFEKRQIKTGISDGINIEILEGLSKTDKVKVVAPVKEEEKKG